MGFFQDNILLIAGRWVRVLYIVSPGLLNTEDIIQEQCESYYLMKDNRPLAARDPLPSPSDKSNGNWMGKSVLVICL